MGAEGRWSRIVRARPIQTTAELVQAIGGPAGRYVKGKGGERKRTIHPATRTFQALRIAVNDELGALEQVLPAAINCLAPGGRLGVISFHSLEDRMVKQAFRKAAGKAEVEIGNKYDQWSLPPKSPEPKVKIITKRPIVAEDQERSENPRSRSAKLRFIEKL
ncbi:hypothetical protein CYMTET_17995 [Cymbomonas tetramitiformis]|uniref:Uncharacterized protein n=1 Tax=Cymbomonas tetramitiformis TaxID=36881 RepID=A0AAE0L6D4_9CHLO|nr:hypothetical protein CYMTET_17995 [Cymbomonas tetramitiformis]